MTRERWVPFTPAGSMLADLERPSEEAAWRALERAAAHMPYPDRDAFKRRGYTVEQLIPMKAKK